MSEWEYAARENLTRSGLCLFAARELVEAPAGLGRRLARGLNCSRTSGTLQPREWTSAFYRGRSLDHAPVTAGGASISRKRMECQLREKSMLIRSGDHLGLDRHLRAGFGLPQRRLDGGPAHVHQPLRKLQELPA